MNYINQKSKDLTGEFLKDEELIKEGKVIPIKSKNRKPVDETKLWKKLDYQSEKEIENKFEAQETIQRTITLTPVDKIFKELSYEAFLRISSAVDEEHDIAERSNCFDDWKDLLVNLAQKTDKISTNHRKILGAIIVATMKFDISDFDKETLSEYRNITNILRQPRVNKKDVEKTIELLHKKGQKTTLPLAVDNLTGDQENELEEKMKKFLKKSSEGN